MLPSPKRYVMFTFDEWEQLKLALKRPELTPNEYKAFAYAATTRLQEIIDQLTREFAAKAKTKTKPKTKKRK